MSRLYWACSEAAATRQGQQPGQNETFSMFRDQVGTVKALFNAAQDVVKIAVKIMEYDSFGVPLADSRPDVFFPLGFAGGLHDEHSGLVRFGKRDYLPELGRFTTRDPAMRPKNEGQNGDWYTYCGNDPVNFTDPKGLWTQANFDESKVSRDSEGKFASSGSRDTKTHEGEISAFESLSGAVKNAGVSLANFAEGLGNVLLNPGTTAVNMSHVIKGYIDQALGFHTESRQYSDAVTEYIIDKYGSYTAVKKSFRDDPVGVIADLSTAISGGGAVIKVAGVTSKVASVSTAGKLSQALSSVSGAANSAGSKILHISSTIDPTNIAAKIGGKAMKDTAIKKVADKYIKDYSKITVPASRISTAVGIGSTQKSTEQYKN